MKPILTVTLNAAVDKTYTVPGFALNRVHRPTEMLVTAGGKGINVARVYQLLGGSATATGFLGGSSGEYIARSLVAEGVSAAFVTVKDESRLCMAIMDPVAGTQTELNEGGPQITADDCTTLFGRLRELLPVHGAVVLSGSIPLGTPATIYRDIIVLAQEDFGVRAVLDSSGEPLAQGIAAKPFLVKPNVHELAALAVGSDGWGGAAAEIRSRYGVPLAMVTGGPRGAVLAAESGIWEATPPSIEVRSAVGSGDSLTAAFLWSYAQDGDPAEAMRLGVAAGAANALTYGAGFCDPAQVAALAVRTQVNKLG